MALTINAKNYVAAKSAGGVEIKKYGKDSLEVSVARFSESTGEPIIPSRAVTTLAELQAQRAELQATLDGIDAMIADAEKLNGPA